MTKMFKLPPGRKYTDYIFTYSGQYIYPEDISPKQIKLVDIAYHLAGIYRYNGATRISVLRHSIAVSRLCEYPEAKRLALFHDAAEAYLMDVPVPKKKYMKEGWSSVYDRIEGLIYDKYNVDSTPQVKADVSAQDKRVVEYEMNSREMLEPGNQMRYPSPATIGSYEWDEIHHAYLWKHTEQELMSKFMDLTRRP